MSDKPRVYFTGTLYPFYEVARPILEPRVEVVAYPGRMLSPTDMLEAMRDVDGVLITTFEKMPRPVIEALPRLRAISKYGVGLENIDIEAATERGIPVTNCPGANALGVAEHAMALMLSLFRQVPRLDRMLREGRWLEARSLMSADIEGSTLGVVGIGNIGRLVTQRAKGMGMRVIAYDPYVPADAVERAGAEKYESLEDLVAEADAVTLHVLVSKENKGMFDEAMFRRMKPTAFFINTARAVLVDQDALLRALQEGWIAGAGLDVLDPEPLPPDSPFLKLDNAIITPHHSGSTVKTRERTLKQAATNLVRMLAGDLPEVGLADPGIRERFAGGGVSPTAPR